VANVLGVGLSKELVIALVFIICTTVLTAADVLADLNEGGSFEHIAIEVSVIIAGSLGILMILRHLILNYQNVIRLSNEDLMLSKKQAEKWQSEARTLIQGLATQIDSQFSTWSFTPAEKEVALLLIKGLALREIAEIRRVHEKTVRLQCTSIYKKSGLRGRAEVSAFFLEDLLSPSNNLGHLNKEKT
jgi:DNA-binding CsgD family transcriptional regulator